MESIMASFKEAFAAARKEKGKGKTFTFEGKSYSTDYAEDKKSPAAAKSTPARPTGGGKAMQAAKMGATSSNVASNKAAAKRKEDAKPKSEGLGSRIMGASASAGKALGDYLAGEKPKPRVGTTTNYKAGGVVKMKEGSAKDMREDKVKAKKAGMTMKQWESSAADKKHDAPKKMMSGGAVKKATGGSMRGTGAAVRGKGFSGCY